MNWILLCAVLVAFSFSGKAQDMGAGIPEPPPVDRSVGDTTLYRCVMQSGYYDHTQDLHTFQYDIIPIDGPDLIPTHEFELNLDMTQDPEAFIRIFSMGIAYAVDSTKSGQIFIAWEKGYLDFKTVDDRIVSMTDGVSGAHIWTPNEHGQEPRFNVSEIGQEIVPQAYIGALGEEVTYRGQYVDKFILYGEDGVDQHTFQFTGVRIPQTNEGSVVLDINLDVMSDQDVHMLKEIFKNGPSIPEGQYPIDRQFFIFKVKDGLLLEITGLGSDRTWSPAPDSSVPVIHIERYESDGPVDR